MIKVHNLKRSVGDFPSEWTAYINDDIKLTVYYRHSCITVEENGKEVISGHVYGQPGGEMDTSTMIKIVSVFGYKFDD